MQTTCSNQVYDRLVLVTTCLFMCSRVSLVNGLMSHVVSMGSELFGHGIPAGYRRDYLCTLIERRLNLYRVCMRECVVECLINPFAPCQLIIERHSWYRR